MSCSVCNHPQCRAIDQALLDRTATLTKLSQQHGLSTSALSRHKLHLKGKMARAQIRFQEMLREGYLFILYELLAAVHRIARTAAAEGDSRLLLQASRQGTGIMKFMAKLDGSFSAETLHRLLASTQWAETESLLPTVPQFVAQCHQAMADSLFAPCPESALGLAEALAAAPLDDADLAELARLHPELLQELAAHLSQLEISGAGTPHPTRREKGGKKAGKSPDRRKYCKKNQLDNQNKKLTGKSSGQLPKTWKLPLETPLSGSGNWIEDLDSGRINIDLLNAIAVGRQPLDQSLVR